MKKRITALTAAAMMGISPVITTSAAGIPAAEDSSDFLTDCSSRAGYDYLGTMENGEELQQVYEQMCKYAEKLWNDTDSELEESWGFRTYAMLTYDGLSYDDMGKVYFTFKNDFPLYYFADNTTIGDWFFFYMTADQSYAEGSARAKAQKDIKDYIIRTARKAEGAGSDYEKVKIVHDAINADLKYAYESPGVPSNEPWAHNILGACQNGEGVCECYARTFQAVLNYLDIDNYFVSGTAEGGDHAWNAVRLDDGSCYYVDCTWDDMLGGVDYFAKGEKTMSKDHAVDKPTDDSMHFFIELPDISYTDFDPSGIGKERAKGDVNGDGSVNVTDVSLTAAHIKSIKALSGFDLKAADINGDGKVTVTDLSRLAAMVKGKA